MLLGVSEAVIESLGQPVHNYMLYKIYLFRSGIAVRAGNKRERREHQQLFYIIIKCWGRCWRHSRRFPSSPPPPNIPAPPPPQHSRSPPPPPQPLNRHRMLISLGDGVTDGVSWLQTHRFGGKAFMSLFVVVSLRLAPCCIGRRIVEFTMKFLAWGRVRADRLFCIYTCTQVSRSPGFLDQLSGRISAEGVVPTGTWGKHILIVVRRGESGG